MNEPQVTIVGNVVADPELRISQAGRPWVSLRIASTPRVRDRSSQEWVDGETMWINAIAYGDFAENIANSVNKGVRVVVQGRLSVRSYQDNQGQTRTGLDLQIDEIGPSLRFATAQISRSAARAQGGQYAPAAAQGQTGWAAPAQGQSGWAQPAQPAQNTVSPWGEPPAGGDSDLDQDIRF